jgi:glycosyltransferase involved in cell wall biosynthesis
MIPLTVLILTRDEEANITRTIAALPDVTEIVVVDSLSTDGTVALAAVASSKVRIVSHPFDSHTAQWNFGLDQVQTEWVLTLDADYELSPELRAEIVALNPPDDVSGYSADFIYRIYGHSLRGSSYPPRVVLFRVRQARYVDDGHTQLLKTNGRLGRLSGRIYHDDRKPLSHWLRAQDDYAKLEARHLRALPIGQLSRQDKLRRAIFFAAPAIFLYLMFVRGLVLDGWPGWFYVAQRTIAELILSVRLLIGTKKLEDGSQEIATPNC